MLDGGKAMKNEIFILIDDSDKLNSNENSGIFGGLFFFSNKEQRLYKLYQ